ncbi:MAG: ABC transporter ATP-binding protein [Sphingomicrobium sp.]
MTSLVRATGLALAARLSPTDFASPGGELIALVGPNGGGKTSLLRALAGVEAAAGAVAVGGEELDRVGEARRRLLVALLPASREVAWPIAVRDVIALGLRASDPKRVEELIAAFELEPLANRSIGAISTGERARALMARALAARPRLLLLDEPLANLDPYWVLRTLELLRAAASEGATVMVALHDLAQIERFDRLLLLKDGQVKADGTPGDLKDQLGALFGVEATPEGWRINRTAGPRSSP